LFFDAIWALTSGGFRIISDTLVRQVLGMCQNFSTRWCTGGAGPGNGFTPDFCISVVYLKKLWTDFD